MHLSGIARLAPVALAIAAAAAACGKGSADPSGKPGAKTSVAAKARDGGPPDADPSKLDGAGLYAAFCTQCHGDDLAGGRSDHAPSLANPTFLASATDEFLRMSIARGRPGTAMGAYGSEVGGPLGPVPMTKLVTWIRGHGGPAQPLPPLHAGGDATRGAELYAKQCQVCHGDRAVRGEALHLANPQFLVAASDAFLAYAIANGRPGTKMIAWQAALDPQQIADIVAFVRSLARAAPIGMLPAPTGKEPLVLNASGKDPSWTLRADPCNGAGCKPDPRFVSADAVKQALDAKRKVVIIDARPQAEWMRVHIDGAVSIPYHDMKRLDEIPADAWVVAYCACPHHLSGIVVDELRKRGHTKSAVLDEGINEWHRRGYPVVAAPGVTPPPAEAPAPVAPAPTTLRPSH